jgi:hypothetical protein
MTDQVDFGDNFCPVCATGGSWRTSRDTLHMFVILRAEAAWGSLTNRGFSLRSWYGRAVTAGCAWKSRHIRPNRVTFVAQPPCNWRDSVL